MAKPLYVYTGTDWVPVASELESTSQYATTTYVDNKVGLDHLHTETFTSTATVSINDVFSADYDNYKILFYAKGSTNLGYTLKMRASGSDEGGSVYDVAIVYNNGASVFGGDTQNTTGILLGSTSTLANNFATIDILRPNVAIETALTVDVSNWSATAQRKNVTGILVQTSTQYDGFSLIPSTGNITGQLNVYGYKD